MKKIILLSAFAASVSSASTLEVSFSRLLKPDGGACLEDVVDEDMGKKCALDLCGPPHQVPSNYLRDYSVPELSKSDTSKRYGEVSPKVEQIIDRLVENKVAFTVEIKKRNISPANLKYSSWKQKDYDLLAQQIYGIFLRPSYTMDNKLKFSYQNVDKSSSDFLLGLRSFAKGIEGQVNFSKPYLCDEACKVGVKKHLSGINFQALSAKIAEEAKSPVLRSKIRQTYKSELLMTNLKPVDVDSFRKLIPQIQDEFIRSLHFLSAESKEKFKDHLATNVQYYIHLRDDGSPVRFSTDDFVKDFNSKALPEKESFGNVAIPELISELLYHIKDNGSAQSGIKFYPENTIAGDARGEATSTNKEMINISYFSVLNPEIGRQYLKHEFAHVLSGLFKKNLLSKESKAAYLRKRSCVTSNYTYAYPVTDYFKGDTVFSEEDMADALSNLSSPNEKLQECSAFIPSASGLEYEDTISIDSNSNDTHSTTLTRLIMEALYKGRSLPESCQEVMRKSKPLLRYKTCK